MLLMINYLCFTFCYQLSRFLPLSSFLIFTPFSVSFLIFSPPIPLEEGSPPTGAVEKDFLTAEDARNLSKDCKVLINSALPLLPLRKTLRPLRLNALDFFYTPA